MDPQRRHPRRLRLLTQTVDHGDGATTDDDMCTTTSYARHVTNYLIDYPAEVTTRAGTDCATGNRLEVTRSGQDHVGG